MVVMFVTVFVGLIDLGKLSGSWDPPPADSASTQSARGRGSTPVGLCCSKIMAHYTPGWIALQEPRGALWGCRLLNFIVRTTATQAGGFHCLRRALGRLRLGSL